MKDLIVEAKVGYLRANIAFAIDRDDLSNDILNTCALLYKLREIMNIVMIGTGYVGLVSGVCFSELGNNVVCVDKDKKIIDNLNSGIVPIFEPSLEELVHKNMKKGRLRFSKELKSEINSADIIFIAVGTPRAKKTERLI